MARTHSASIAIPAWFLLGALAAAQSTTRVSVGAGGAQANSTSFSPSISGDGVHVAFVSNASNLVAGDTNGFGDVFVRDRQSSSTVRVSVDSAGVQGNLSSSAPSISGDGRLVAFASGASNLVTGDTNGTDDIFVRDLMTNSTTRVSTSAAGVQGNGPSYVPSISGDGRFVAFASASSNLVAGDTNSAHDIFVRDLVTGSITRVSVDSAGIQGNDFSSSASISTDGLFVAFQSDASNLVSSDTNVEADVFVYDRLNASTARASTSTAGTQGNFYSGRPRISSDGRFVAFFSYASTLVTGDTNGAADVFLRDTLTNVTSRISVTYSGAQALSGSSTPSISGNGRFVAYESSAAILPGGGSPQQVYVYDTATSSVLRISAASGGIAGNSFSSFASGSADGSQIAFDSNASNLVPGDSNGVSDIFVSDLTSPPWALYCFGDGSATACPCGNASGVGAQAGCLNSTGTGAHLDATGMPSVAGDTLLLHGTGMTNGTCLYFQGTAQLNNGLGVVLGDGLRCASGTVIRLGIKANAGGASQYPGAGEQAVSVKGLCTPGLMRSYQVWYRDAATFCAPETYNLTNGLALAWRP